MMRMNENKHNYDNVDVYSDLDTSYSSTYFAPDNQEFSLQSVQKKLGDFRTIDESAQSGALNADVMPSQQTLTMNYQREYQSNVATAKKVSTKTKVLAVSYVAVVLALILGITFASVAVSGAFGETLKLTADYTEVAEQVAVLESQLAEEDFDSLVARAAELGYIEADNANTQTYTRVETRPAQNFNIETNWFDSLCDWISGVFGG